METEKKIKVVGRFLKDMFMFESPEISLIFFIGVILLIGGVGIISLMIKHAL